MTKKELKLKYTREDVEQLNKDLRKAIIEAQEDYKRKKKAKGEKVDYWKMLKAINQRKKVKIISNRALAGMLNLCNLLDKPALNRASEQLERKALELEKK